MQSLCHALQQRLAHTHLDRDRQHLDTQVAIKLQMPSAHCPCCCFVAAVEERVENISLKCVPPLECSSPPPPHSYSTSAQPASHFTYSTFTFPTLPRQFRAP